VREIEDARTFAIRTRSVPVSSLPLSPRRKSSDACSDARLVDGKNVSALTSAQRRRRSLTAKDRKAFLDALAAGWSVRHAAERTGRRFQSFYEERERDEGFAAQWEQAFEAGTCKLEDEATRRGVEGYDEETYDGEDKLIRRVRRYDSALLQQQLKRRRPEAYRENAGVELKTPAIFILQSAFGPTHDIEAEAVESPPELPSGEAA